MTNSNSQGLWITDPAAYRKQMEALLQGREPLDVLAQTPSALAAVASSNTLEKLRARPFEGKWTPLEIIGHLADGELIYGYRVRMILTEERPAIAGMDQDRWVAVQGYNARTSGELVSLFSALRTANLTLYRSLAASQLAREGQHAERGGESIDTIITMLAGHDLHHLDQIARYLKAGMAAD